MKWVKKKLNERRVIFLVLFHLLILGCTVARLSQDEQEDIVIDTIALHRDSGEIVSEDGFCENWSYNMEYQFKAWAYHLKKGVYRVTVSYDTNADKNYLSLTANGAYTSLLTADNYMLNSNKSELIFPIWLKHPAELLGISIQPLMPENGVENPYLRINSITIEKQNAVSYSYFLCTALAYLLLFDLVLLCIYKRKSIKENIYVILGLGAAVVVSSLGVLDSDLPMGHDLPFHFARIWGVAEGIATGQFPVRIQPGWCNGYGFAVSIFYADLFLYFPALLNLLGLPLVTAYRIYVVGINIGTVLLSYFSFKRIGKSKPIGTVCSILYALSMYRICNLYLRAAVGEYTAMMFYPVIVLGMWEILHRGPDEKPNKYSWMILTAGMTGIIQSHVLSCEMVVIFLFLTCIVCIKTVLQKETFLLLLKSVGATIGLNAFFLIPFIDYSREDLDVFAPHSFYGIQDKGLTIYDLLAFTTKGRGNVGHPYQSRIPVVLGAAAILILLLGIIILVRNKEWKEKEKSNIAYGLLFAGLSAAMTLTLFPWDAIEKIGPLHQLVGTLQFPFRFMAICMVFVSFLACLLFAVCEKKIHNKKDYKVLLLLLCFVSAWQGMEFIDRILYISSNFIIADGRALAEDNVDTIYGGQYYYTGTDYNVVYSQNEPEGGAEIDEWKRNGIGYTVTCRTMAETCLEIPLFYYPDYRCIDTDTGEEYTVIKGENNKLCVSLPQNYDGTLQIGFKEPWFWRAGEIISLVFLLFLIILRRKNAAFKKA